MLKGERPQSAVYLLKKYRYLNLVLGVDSTDENMNILKKGVNLLGVGHYLISFRNEFDPFVKDLIEPLSISAECSDEGSFYKLYAILLTGPLNNYELTPDILTIQDLDKLADELNNLVWKGFNYKLVEQIFGKIPQMNKEMITKILIFYSFTKYLATDSLYSQLNSSDIVRKANLKYEVF